VEQIGYVEREMCFGLWVWNGLVVLDGSSAVCCGSGTDWVCWAVTVLQAVGVERIDCFGRYMCCRLWVWNGLVVLEARCALGCVCGTDSLCLTVTVL
jgi:hypothetical protein